MRTAWRLFFHHRSLSVVAVSTLAVALGLATALAAVADAILFRPLPVARPAEIVHIFTASPQQPLGFVSYPDFEDFRRASRTLAGMVAQSQVLLAAGADPARMQLALAVTPDYFDLLGVAISPGRGFKPEESREPVVVLSRAYWQAQFAGDPRVIGRTMLLCGIPFTILGVAPENFALDRFSREDLYFPIGAYAARLLPVTGRPLEDRSRRYLAVYARLAPGESIQQAQAELATIADDVASRFPADRNRRAVVLSEFQARTRTDRTMPSLAALLGALAVLILLIAGANFTCLLLAKSEARARETAVRMAVGATRARLVRENLAESVALTAAGAILAIPLAHAAQQILARATTLPTDFSFSIAPRIDARIAASLLVIAAFLAVLCGLAPAPRDVEIAAALKARTSRAPARARRVLAIFEIALATALLACLGFLLRGIAAAQHTDLGYRTDHVLLLALDPAQLRYNEPQTRAFFEQALTRVRGMPGAKSAELAQSVPLGYSSAQRQLVLAGETLTLWMNIVGPSYFDLLHLPIVAGRSFDQRDVPASTPVAVVNQELAKRCGLGCAFRMDGREVRVIGVVRTARYFAVSEPPRPYFYLPFSQNYASRMVLHVETVGDPAAMAHAVADEIHRLDAAQPLSEIRVLSAYLNQGAMFQARIALRVLGSVGLGGILLALAGLFAVMTHTAARRRHEIGIRMALGASHHAVILLLLADALKVLLPGIALGLAAATAAWRSLTALVPQTGSDLAPLAFASIVVLLTSAPSFLLPARKAAAIDPVQALRAE